MLVVFFLTWATVVLRQANCFNFNIFCERKNKIQEQVRVQHYLKEKLKQIPPLGLISICMCISRWSLLRRTLVVLLDDCVWPLLVNYLQIEIISQAEGEVDTVMGDLPLEIKKIDKNSIVITLILLRESYSQTWVQISKL